MPFFLLSYQPKEILGAGKDAADTLTNTVLGSLIVILAILLGFSLWLAWKSKQSEIQTIKDLLQANSEEKLSHKEFTDNQVQAYKELANTVNNHGKLLETFQIDCNDKLNKGLDSIESSSVKVSKIIDSVNKRVDALAKASKEINTEKYYEERD